MARAKRIRERSYMPTIAHLEKKTTCKKYGDLPASTETAQRARMTQERSTGAGSETPAPTTLDNIAAFLARSIQDDIRERIAAGTWK
jgi:hypothetical protein